MDYVKLIGEIFLMMGSFSLFIAAIGLLRMPDVYNRVQTGTKASTLGAIMSFVGIGLMAVDHWDETNWIGRVIVLIVFIIITNPVSSHVLMRAAYAMKIPLSKITSVDKLKEDIENKILEEPIDE
ncbi:MAG: Na+/H+ antiporter subunit G [Bacteroidetes bacterium]|nr:MAG: Na+/H+ antiporter subunit G [Bacteroidota bacterium]